MKTKTIFLAALITALPALVYSFTPGISFSEQIRMADAVARIVVIDIQELDYDEVSGFEGLAQCRIVTDYTDSFSKVEFIYLPCRYPFDESPCELYVGSDYIVCLETMRHARIAHPVSYDALHEISHRRLIDPESKDLDAWVSVAEFEAIIKKHWEAKKAEQGADGRSATSEKSKAE